MKNEIEFLKYKKRGAYHWDQISYNLIKRNCFVKARYNYIIKLIKKHFNKIDVTGKKIIDIGCGDGVLSYLLAKKTKKKLS